MSTAASHLPPSLPGRAPWGTAQALRAWQQEALDAYAAAQPRDFLAVATPGAGKTTFALRVAADLLARRVVEAITVVAPTEHLKRQWSQAAHRAGHALDPEFSNGQGALGEDFLGVVVTYAQVAAHPLLHRRRTEQRRTLVILDEVHHAADALSWGEAAEEAFDPRHAKAVAHRHPLPERHQPDPVRALRTGRRRRPPVRGRPPLRLRRRAPRRRRPTRDLPGLHAARCDGAPARATRWLRRWASPSRRTSRPRPGVRRWTRAGRGCPPCWPPRTDGSPRYADTSVTPAGS